MGKSKITGDLKHCFVCGCSEVQIHHVFFGTANRKQSDRLGYIVPLCVRHHTGTEGVHNNRLLDLQIKQYAQRKFEEKDGSREDFIRIFGKSYL